MRFKGMMRTAAAAMAVVVIRIKAHRARRDCSKGPEATHLAASWSGSFVRTMCPGARSLARRTAGQSEELEAGLISGS